MKSAKLFVEKNPPFDLGLSISAKDKALRLSLVFFDLLINLNHKDILVGVGIPFIRAWALHIVF